MNQALLHALLGWACALSLVSSLSCSRESQTSKPGEAMAKLAKDIYPKLIALEDRERKADETVWTKEILAQRCGQAIEQLWDALNASTNKFAIVAEAAVGEVQLPKFTSPVGLPHGIQVRAASGADRMLNQAEWQTWVRSFATQGWELVQAEFRHVRFEPDPSGAPRSSEFYVCGALENVGQAERAVVEGRLRVDWGRLPAGEGSPSIDRIDASHLSVRTRHGELPFQLALDQSLEPPEKWDFIDPLILYDLDGDGRSEIILAARNLVLRTLSPPPEERDRVRGLLNFHTALLCRVDPGLIFTALIADFNGDGAADFLCAKAEGLLLYEGSSRGTFDQPPRKVWSANPPLKFGQVMTGGDIDGDGDLDIWLAQYKVPYNRGQLPTPFYDANDGNPSFLLLNDGKGNFTDATAGVGLMKKRFRRTYSASFADIDNDGDLDLIVVSDFCGVDLYLNDGHGHFTDVTRQRVAEPYAAGMAHAWADFDCDGRLDLLVMGMTSPTVDRLEALNLTRPEPTVDQTKRAKLMFGNRLLLAKADGGFAQTPLSDSITRSGWSWGCSALDFDNDGFLDVYIANGHETKAMVRDYEGEYWLHDLYVGDSNDDPLHVTYLASKAARTRGRGLSFGGWERNRLYLNQRGQMFVEAGFLLGVSLQQDSRNVATDDLDGDGRLDLLVTTFEAWPEKKQTLKVFRNNANERGNWIGIRLREQGGGISPVGARVTLRSTSGTTTSQIVTGDSYRSQHANVVHFGLGTLDKVESIEVRWVGGAKVELRAPAINRYHDVAAPNPKR